MSSPARPPNRISVEEIDAVVGLVTPSLAVDWALTLVSPEDGRRSTFKRALAEHFKPGDRVYVILAD